MALEDFLANSLMPPSVSDNIMEYLNQFARQASRLTAIGGAFLLVTSLLLIMTIDKAFNDIWHVTRQRPLPQRALVYWRSSRWDRWWPGPASGPRPSWRANRWGWCATCPRSSAWRFP